MANRLRNLPKHLLIDLCRQHLPARIVRRMEGGQVEVLGSFAGMGKPRIMLRIVDHRPNGILVRRLITYIAVWEIRQPIGEPYRVLASVWSRPPWENWVEDYPADRPILLRRVKRFADAHCLHSLKSEVARSAINGYSNPSC